MQRRIRVGKAAARLVGGEREIVGIEKRIDLSELLGTDNAGFDADPLLISNIPAQSLFVFRRHDLDEPGGGKAGRAGADFLVPVAEDAQTLMGEPRLQGTGGSQV